MRRFLKRLRKGIKGACLTAVLATCWQVGQVAQAGLIQQFNPGDEVTVEFSGTVSPTVNNLSHLFLIYQTGTSSDDYYFTRRYLKLGDFPSGQTTAFSVLGTINYDDRIEWKVAALYGDISSGQYIEGINGVTLGSGLSDGASWDTYTYMDEPSMFNYLLNDEPQNMGYFKFFFANYNSEANFSRTMTLYDFSQASYNGQLYIESEVVPEPITIALLGTGGLVILRRRRDDD